MGSAAHWRSEGRGRVSSRALMCARARERKGDIREVKEVVEAADLASCAVYCSREGEGALERLKRAGRRGKKRESSAPIRARAMTTEALGCLRSTYDGREKGSVSVICSVEVEEPK